MARCLVAGRLWCSLRSQCVALRFGDLGAAAQLVALGLHLPKFFRQAGLLGDEWGEEVLYQRLGLGALVEHTHGRRVGRTGRFLGRALPRLGPAPGHARWRGEGKIKARA